MVGSETYWEEFSLTIRASKPIDSWKKRAGVVVMALFVLYPLAASAQYEQQPQYPQQPQYAQQPQAQQGCDSSQFRCRRFQVYPGILRGIYTMAFGNLGDGVQGDGVETMVGVHFMFRYPYWRANVLFDLFLELGYAGLVGEYYESAGWAHYFVASLCASVAFFSDNPSSGYEMSVFSVGPVVQTVLGTWDEEGSFGVRAGMRLALFYHALTFDMLYQYRTTPSSAPLHEGLVTFGVDLVVALILIIGSAS